ncbi:iron chaperone [Bacillus nakamurai]|uniref:Iron chaperone n=1 Tax=Bacillus nakamurai TaxID=1793963 RepID=A0A150F6M1_9BACI|nr:iron chaperone [Bacillus nakamurai]KXZ18837.1 iron chaperone [Bacillus nakamurai]MCC9021348.1 iron chaperone [Bacillus nakamurai]MCP6683518.1 iron chaperone [Bacillus nakamurai]MED1226058.1 iron chaperone [Bacillus nakamurai]
MDVFKEYLANIDHTEHRARTEKVLVWITKEFPNLMPAIKWNQPMFTDHGTFIIGFSVSKNHLAVSPERAGIIHFSDDIVQAGYEHTKQLVRIPWDRPVDFSLLKKMIEFNMVDKADCSTFWRK